MARDSRERINIPLEGIYQLLIGGQWLPVDQGRLRYLDRYQVYTDGADPIYAAREPLLAVLNDDGHGGATFYRVDAVQGYRADFAAIERQDGPGADWVAARPTAADAEAGA